MRTLVISDLHLGNRAQHDVLRLPVPRARLLEALHDVDRLVLLGDLAELMGRHPRRSMTIAEPVLRAIGQHLGGDREVVVVVGNHDALLLRDWALAKGPRLTVDTIVEPNVTRALARLVSWLRPAQVRVNYPGVWLADGVWATHGHYLDRYLLPESAFGLPRRVARGRARARSGPIGFERARGRRLSRRAGNPFLTRLWQRPLATLLESGVQAVRTAAVPALPRLLMQARLAPVTAAVIDLQMRHAGIPAMARVVRRLDVQAEWVVFGHVHRAGPLDGEPDDSWRGSGGSPRFVNTGSWLYEPMLVDRASPPHPYWPGGAVLLEDGRAPRVIGLLDGLSASDLRPADR